MSSSWLASDAHAGGSVGILIGSVFLTLGFTITFVKNKAGNIPDWRKSIGIFIVLSGAIALITGLIFVAHPSNKYSSVKITDVSKVIESDTLIHSPMLFSLIEVGDGKTEIEKQTNIEITICLPASVKVEYESDLTHIINLPYSYTVTASVGTLIDGVQHIFIAGQTKDNDNSNKEYNFIFRFIKVESEEEKFVLIERFPVAFEINTLESFQTATDLTLQTNSENLIWKKKTNLNKNGQKS
jgi:hypothetical protein